MGSAVSCFTVAIATASTCLVTKRNPLSFVAIILSLIAMARMVVAWMS